MSLINKGVIDNDSCLIFREFVVLLSGYNNIIYHITFWWLINSQILRFLISGIVISSIVGISINILFNREQSCQIPGYEWLIHWELLGISFELVEVWVMDFIWAIMDDVTCHTAYIVYKAKYSWSKRNCKWCSLKLYLVFHTTSAGNWMSITGKRLFGKRKRLSPCVSIRIWFCFAQRSKASLTIFGLSENA